MIENGIKIMIRYFSTINKLFVYNSETATHKSVVVMGSGAVLGQNVRQLLGFRPPLSKFTSLHKE